MPALVKKPGQCTLGTKRNLKRLADFLKIMFKVVFRSFFQNVYLSLTSGKLNTRDQGIWKLGQGGGQKSQKKRLFFFKDFFASRKCKVWERNLYVSTPMSVFVFVPNLRTSERPASFKIQGRRIDPTTK